MTFHERNRRRLARLAVLVALLAGAQPALAGERLSEGEIGSAFSGVTLDGIYKDGEFFSETYAEDGSIRYHGLSGADSGLWSVQDGRFCTFYENDQGACFVVERDGDNCFSFFVQDDPDRPAETEWTSRGWNRDKPSTCPKVPEIQL